MSTFASYADVVRHLGLSQQDAADQLDVDAVMTALVGTTATIRSACGWSVTEETVTAERVDWDWRDATVFLPTLHLTALAITVDGVASTYGTDFRWSLNGVVKLWRRGRLSAGLWWPTPIIEATYTHGYQTVPDALRSVCAELAGQRVSIAAGISRPLAALTVGNVTEQYERATTVYSTASPVSEADRLRQDARVAPFVLPVVG